MIDTLHLYNFSPSHDLHEMLSHYVTPQSFVLKTCQRHLVLSCGPLAFPLYPMTSLQHQYQYGPNAYQYLLEVVCGLKSQLLGEHEIVAQFKKAMQEYLLNPHRSRAIVIILEKLMQDSKQIRSRFLSHVGKNTYASVAKKIIGPLPEATPILIIGTGQLAEDMLHQFVKTHPLFLCGRNQQRITELKNKFPNLQIIPWGQWDSLPLFSIVINTVGLENYLLFETDFLSQWLKSRLLQHPQILPTFLDLGSPSSVIFPPQNSPQQNFFNLDHVLAQGAMLQEQKIEQIELAKISIEQIALKRTFWLDQKLQRDQQLISCKHKVSVPY